MIHWQTERPQGAIIVAKLTESFTHDKHSYEVLFWNVLGYYYDYAGFWERKDVTLAAIMRNFMLYRWTEDAWDKG